MSGSGRQGIWSRLALADLVAGTAGFGLTSWGYGVLVLGLTSDLWLFLHGMSVCITGVTFWLTMLHFEDPARTDLRWHVQKFFLACGTILMVQSAMVYFLKIEPDHPAVLMGSAVVAIVLPAVVKRWFAPVLRSRGGVLFLGFDSFTEKMVRHMQPAAVGILHEDPAAVPAGLPYLGKPERLAEVAQSMRPGRIIVSGKGEGFQAPARLLLDLRLSGITIDDGLASYEEFFGRACWRRMETSELLFSPFLTTHRLVMSVQVIYTNLAGLALLLASLPLLVAAGAAVALGSGRGPVLERIECLGFQGIPFHMLRFRTHRRNGTSTWIGRVLTRLHIVDLPQLINVVRGEMAFIGPPPVRKEFGARIAQLIPFYSARFTAKPGMLGWSQCQLEGSPVVPDESVRLEYDLYYVQEVVPSLDFEILIRSIFRIPVSRPRRRAAVTGGECAAPRAALFSRGPGRPGYNEHLTSDHPSVIHLVRALVPVGALKPLLIEGVLIAGSLLLATYLLAHPSGEVFLTAENGIARLALVLATLIAAMRMRGLYSPSIRRRPRLFLVQELCLALGFTFIAQGVMAYLNVELRAPIRITLAGGMLAVAAIVAWRSAYGTVVWKAAERPVLFVGNSPLLDEVAAFLEQNPDIGLRLIGYVGEPRPEGGRPVVKNLGRLENLGEIVRATLPGLIVIGQEQRHPMAVATLFELRTAGFRMEEDFAFLEQLCEYFPLTQLRPSRLIFSGGLRARQSRLWDAVDAVMAAAAMLVALPPMLAAGLAVKLSLGGPVLSSEPYTGKHGEVFPLYRFRLPGGEGRTPAGGLIRLLRRVKFEQWPRLFNVLRGEMSFVGPRPERAEFARILSRRIPFYAQRHAVRPGIIGWAQIRYAETPEDSLRRLQYDLYYIKNKSLLLNNYIVLRRLAGLFRPAP